MYGADTCESPISDSIKSQSQPVACAKPVPGEKKAHQEIPVKYGGGELKPCRMVLWGKPAKYV